MTTPIETKARIIAEFSAIQIPRNANKEFFEYNDLGVPVAIAMSANAVTLTKVGVDIIEETWLQLFDTVMNNNPEGDYKVLKDILMDFVEYDNEDEDSE
jgi:hypothetical protein